MALSAAALLLAAGCGAGDRAPDRDATQETAGTTGVRPGEISVEGCVALGQMGVYMLTPAADVPDEKGFGRSAATTGYQLLGQPADFNQYMNKRVRVVGTKAEASDEHTATAPWPTLQVREVDPAGGECR